MSTSIATRQTVTVEFTDAKIIKCVASKDISAYGIRAGESFLLRRIGKHTYEIKKIEILERTELASGSLSFKVRNGDKKEYHPILNRNRLHTCDCAAGENHQGCYHLTLLRFIENAKIRARRKQPARITDLSTRGNLNGNQGFSILRSA